MNQNTDQHDSQQTEAPKDVLSLAGQNFGLDREQTLELVISLGTDSNALTRFAENNPDLEPEERLHALFELVPIAGSVDATNALLEEAGKGAVARNALYLVGAAKEGSELRFEPVEAKTSLLDKQYHAIQRSIKKMERVKEGLGNSFSTMVDPSAEDVEVAVRNLSKLMPAKIAKALDSEVQRVVALAKVNNAPVSAEALVQLRDYCVRKIDGGIASLQAAIVKNRKDESIAAGHRGSVEMSVWSDFADYFGIDTRDLSEGRWSMLSKLRKAFGGETWTQCCRRALAIGKDMGSTNIHDVMRQAERGFGVDFTLLSTDHENYESEKQEYAQENADWDGSEGWT